MKPADIINPFERKKFSRFAIWVIHLLFRRLPPPLPFLKSRVSRLCSRGPPILSTPFRKKSYSLVLESVARVAFVFSACVNIVNSRPMPGRGEEEYREGTKFFRRIVNMSRFLLVIFFFFLFLDNGIMGAPEVSRISSDSYERNIRIGKS